MSYHSISECWAVVNETAAILEKERARKPGLAVTARAHAGSQAKPKPPVQTANARWAAAVAAKMQAGLPHAKAVRAVAIDDPDLHRAYLDEFNTAARKVTDLERQVSRLAAARR